jgi:hypothetical protein
MTGILHKDLCTLMTLSAEFFLKWQLFQKKKVLETHIMFSNLTFSRIACRLWDSVEKCNRARQSTDDNIIRRVRFTCWITKATNTHSTVFNTYCFSTATVVERTPLNISLICTLPIVLITVPSIFPEGLHSTCVRSCRIALSCPLQFCRYIFRVFVVVQRSKYLACCVLCLIAYGLYLSFSVFIVTYCAVFFVRFKML